MSELAASGERLVVRFKKLFWFVLINLDCQIEDRDERKKELPLSMARGKIVQFCAVCVQAEDHHR
jgi:hypothetical protein